MFRVRTIAHAGRRLQHTGFRFISSVKGAGKDYYRLLPRLLGLLLGLKKNLVIPTSNARLDEHPNAKLNVVPAWLSKDARSIFAKRVMVSSAVQCYVQDYESIHASVRAWVANH